MKIVKIKNARLEQFQGAPGNSIAVDTESHGTDDAELYQQSGIYSKPQNDIHGIQIDCGGNNIVIATHDYNFGESIEKGEIIIFSYNASGVLQGKIKIDISGNIIFNDGIKSAVSYAELNAALQLMVTAFNTALGTKSDGSGTAGTVTLDISGAEIEEVKLP